MHAYISVVTREDIPWISATSSSSTGTGIDAGTGTVVGSTGSSKCSKFDDKSHDMWQPNPVASLQLRGESSRRLGCRTVHNNHVRKTKTTQKCKYHKASTGLP